MSFRSFLSTCLIGILTTQIQAQGIVPTLDFNNFFVSFQDGYFRPIEIQPIVSYKAGDEVVAYIDTRGNLKMYDGKERIDVTTLNVDYQVSDHLMAHKIANACISPFLSRRLSLRSRLARGAAAERDATRWRQLHVRAAHVWHFGRSPSLFFAPLIQDKPSGAVRARDDWLPRLPARPHLVEQPSQLPPPALGHGA
jgi:hypothetical protein